MIKEEQLLNSKILIIDDETANVCLLEDLLGERGYKNLKIVTDSRLAFETYKQFKPDLILLDLNMPHVDGMTLLKQFNNVEKDNYAPVMILTAQSDNEIRFEALEAGAKDFLSKPFDLFEVILRIKNMLEVRLLVNQLSKYNAILEEKIQDRNLDLAESQSRLEHEIAEREKVMRQLKRSSERA